MLQILSNTSNAGVSKHPGVRVERVSREAGETDH